MSGGWTPRRNWQAINAVSVAKECSEAHVAFLIADAKGDIADLTTSQAELVEALREILDGHGFLSGGDWKLEDIGISQNRGAEIRAILAKIEGDA